MKTNPFKCAVAAGLLSLCANAAMANTYTFDNSTGIAAEAVFVTSAGQLTITLRNLQEDPNSVAQSLSAFDFTLSAGTAASIASSSGTARNIAADGTFTDSPTSSAGWVLSGTPTTSLVLDVLAGGGAGPAHTLIGDPSGSTYVTGGSISGNGPHNPFLAGFLTFTLNITGLTSSSSVNNVFFQFGTTDGKINEPTQQKVPSVPDGGTTVAMLGSVLVGIHLLRGKMARK